MNEFDDFNFPELSPEAEVLDRALQDFGITTYEGLVKTLEAYGRATNMRLEQGWERFVTIVMRQEEPSFRSLIQTGKFQGVILCLIGAAMTPAKHRQFMEGVREQFIDIRKVLVKGGMSDDASRALEMRVNALFGANGIFPNEEMLDPLIQITAGEVSAFMEKNDESELIEILIERVKHSAMKSIERTN